MLAKLTTRSFSRTYSKVFKVCSSTHSGKGEAAMADSDSHFQGPTLAFIENILQMVKDEAMVKGSSRKTKVIDFKQPEELKKLLSLDINPTGASHEQLLEDCRTTIKYSTQTGHPHFWNLFYQGRDPYALSSAILLEALNTNQHNYEAAPVFTLIEQYIIDRLCKLVGYKETDGLFCPGGSMVNIMAVHLGRFNKNKTIKQEGMFGMKRLVMFTSDQSHYSLWKAAAFLGFGVNSVIPVNSDSRGRMDPDDLERKVKQAQEEGHIPFFVNATSGTTVLGAFDQIDPIADVCQKHDLWLHVDGAWGGGAVLSEKSKHLLKGLERTDSVLLNAHKWWGGQLQTSALVTQHKGLMQECYGHGADYLFQADKYYDPAYDAAGDKTVQCGRKADAFKLWVMWKAHGDAGMAARIDHAYDNARYLTEQLRIHPGFKLVLPEFESTNICWWFIPPSIRGHEENKEWWDQIHKTAPLMKRRMMEAGSMMINFQPMPKKGFVNFFRIVVHNPENTHADMDFIIQEFEKLGSDL